MYGLDSGILFGATLDSPDNAWYINQIKNYLDGLGFTIDPLDPIYSVRRTPGYPIFYGIHYLLLGEEGAHIVIPYTQTFLHALAAVFLFKTTFLIFTNVRIALFTGVLYGLSPFIVSFLFMTITESIFPAMIVFALYLIVSGYVKNSFFYSILAGIMVAVVVLVSPRNGLIMLFFIQLIFYFGAPEKMRRIKINFVFLSAFILTMMPWAIRNYVVMDKFIPLEKYYLNHTMGGENLKNMALYRWWAAWGSPDGLRLHKDIGADIYGDNKYKSIDNFINNEVPAWVYTVEGKGILRELLIDYQSCLSKSINLNGGRRLRYPEEPDICEYQVSDKFDSFTNKLGSQYPFKVYVVSPLYIRGLQYIFHSTVHNWRSLDDYKNDVFKMFFKGFAYFINVLLWIFSILYLLSSRARSEKFLLGIVPVTSFLFIVYYRHVEGRYLLGVYPFLYIMTAVFLNESLLPFISKIFSYVSRTRLSN
jgi:hypothetical protein